MDGWQFLFEHILFKARQSCFASTCILEINSEWCESLHHKNFTPLLLTGKVENKECFFDI